MRIQQISNNYNRTNTNFKSAIPAVFWEKTGQEVNLVHNFNLIQRLGNILVRRANGKGGCSKKAMAERQTVMEVLYKKDRDYHLAYDQYNIPGKFTLSKSITGFFYPKKEKTGWQYGKFNPRAIFMTGQDFYVMGDFGKKIGIATKSLDESKIKIAKENYMKKGRDLGTMQTNEELHIIVEKINDGYKILKLDLYPPKGPKSPYTIMGYYNYA